MAADRVVRCSTAPAVMIVVAVAGVVSYEHAGWERADKSPVQSLLCPVSGGGGMLRSAGSCGPDPRLGGCCAVGAAAEPGTAPEPGVLARSWLEARCTARSRSANAVADRRNSAPVTASQCHRYGFGDKVVDAW